MSVIFSTAWYIFKCKFNVDTYLNWIDNMLSNLNNYNLVIYTCDTGAKYLEKYVNNQRIRLIIKPYEQFYNYTKYGFNAWNENHDNNHLLNILADYRVNMLWCEKVHFVYETMANQYFNSDFYGWCDIGYFRSSNDMSSLINWPSHDKINALDPTKIHYALVNNNEGFINMLKSRINNKNSNGLPCEPIPETQISIAGGFFISHKDNIKWWRDTFDQKLELYFAHNYLVVHDQTIIADCVFSDPDKFCLYTENIPGYDNWFMFQRLLN